MLTPSCLQYRNTWTHHRMTHCSFILFYPLVHKSRYSMSSSSIFNQRMMKEQKMFLFDPPPGLCSPPCLWIGVFVWPVNESNREYHCGTFHPLCFMWRDNGSRRLSIRRRTIWTGIIPSWSLPIWTAESAFCHTHISPEYWQHGHHLSWLAKVPSRSRVRVWGSEF